MKDALSRLAVALVVGGLIAAIPPAAAAAGRVTLTTRYPAVAVAPGSKVTFEIGIRTDVSDRVDLSLAQVPTDWVATIRGEGFVVDGVQTDGDEPVTVELDVNVPATAPAGTERIVLAARSGPARANLDLDVRVQSDAGGQVTLASDHPELRGASDDEFKFSLRLTNDTAEEQTFGLEASGPAGWQIEAKPGGAAQAASAVVDAGGNATIDVTATAPPGTEAGRYPVLVRATSADHTVEAELSVEVTGSFAMEVTTPDGRLNTRGTAGSPIEQSIVIRNSGTAPLQGVALSESGPSGWDVTFEPATVDVPAGGDATVLARITPSGEAIAGDYLVTIRAANDVVDGEAAVRVSVETSIVWGVLGVALILAVILVLGWVFRRYGRR